MQHTEEWDWPPRRRHYRTFRAYRTIDVYQPNGWNSPIAKKAVHIYWRVTITILKMIIAVPLSIMTIAAFWALWIIATKFNFS